MADSNQSIIKYNYENKACQSFLIFLFNGVTVLIARNREAKDMQYFDFHGAFKFHI